MTLRDASALPFPGIRWGDYPERAEPEDGGARPRPHRRSPSAAELDRRLARVRAHCADWRTLGDAGFQTHRHDLLLAIARHGLAAEQADFCCAFAVEAARRALGQRAYDGQVIAALHMLDNRLVEMATGEGKSLAVALAAAMGGLAGIPVHVMTANDYLVQRDAQTFGPMYQLLGLGVAAVVAGQPAPERRMAYTQAIVYVTAKELAFDYLRDRLSHGGAPSLLVQRVSEFAVGGPGAAPPRRLLRGLCMAIVDEADSILIDEAQTPLVLSREVSDPAARAFLWQAWALSGQLEAGRDFTLLPTEGRALLSQAGRERVAELAAALQPVWKNAHHRDDTIATALTARHVLARDIDYVVSPPDARQRSGEIAIVDPTTGRIAEGRKWASGLHALVAIKEGCRADADLETLARITFQRFFSRYHRLGGMSGTLREACAELAAVYGLDIVPVAPRLPSQREQWATRVFATHRARWEAVVARTRTLVEHGRPVLIGTDSVADSIALAALLRRAGIEPALLHAAAHRDEAELIARAGRTGQVTVSTHMAGRGTDISPDGRALRAGGLHVIVCQHNGSRRLDRQLAGRAGRQGQPGSAELWLSLESPGWRGDPIGRSVARLARKFVRDGEVRWPAGLTGALFSLQQRWTQARQADRRAHLLREDRALDRHLPIGPRA